MSTGHVAHHAGTPEALRLSFASISRLTAGSSNSPQAFIVTFSIQGWERATNRTLISGWPALFEFLTQTLHVDHQVAEEILIKLESEGTVTIGKA